MQIILIENTQFVTELSLLGPGNLCLFVLNLSFFFCIASSYGLFTELFFIQLGNN